MMGSHQIDICNKEREITEWNQLEMIELKKTIIPMTMDKTLQTKAQVRAMKCSVIRQWGWLCNFFDVLKKILNRTLLEMIKVVILYYVNFSTNFLKS